MSITSGDLILSVIVMNMMKTSKINFLKKFKRPSKQIFIILSADGEQSEYAANYTGGNKELVTLLKSDPYYYRYFRYSVLQTLPSNITQREIVAIENLYKQKLGSKMHGLNRNWHRAWLGSDLQRVNKRKRQPHQRFERHMALNISCIFFKIAYIKSIPSLRGCMAPFLWSEFRHGPNLSIAS